MLRLRPYKPCDAQSLVQWLTDEAGFWKWCAGRYDHYPVTADDINNFYDSFRMKDDFWQMTMLDDTKGAFADAILRYGAEAFEIWLHYRRSIDPWKRIRHADADTGTDVCIYHFEGGAGVTGRI